MTAALAAGTIMPAWANEPVQPETAELEETQLPSPENLLVDRAREISMYKLKNDHIYAAVYRLAGGYPTSNSGVATRLSPDNMPIADYYLMKEVREVKKSTSGLKERPLQ